MRLTSDNRRASAGPSSVKAYTGRVPTNKPSFIVSAINGYATDGTIDRPRVFAGGQGCFYVDGRNLVTFLSRVRRGPSHSRP